MFASGITARGMLRGVKGAEVGRIRDCDFATGMGSSRLGAEG